MKIKLGPKGFTLVEVMIVVAIVGIMAAIASPMITNMLPRYRLRAEARELVINFKKAKMEAVKRNRDVVIAFTLGVGALGGYQMCVDTDNDNDCILPSEGGAADIPLVDQRLRADVQLMSTTLNPAGYNSRGLPLGAANQNVVLGTNDGPPPSRSYTLTVSAAGSVRLQ